MYYNYNTGGVDVNIEAGSALSNAHQLNNWLYDNSTLEYFINDGASDDRAIRCCVSDHHYHNGRGRSRLVVVEVTTNNIKCTYVYKCLIVCNPLFIVYNVIVNSCVNIYTYILLCTYIQLCF